MKPVSPDPQPSASAAKPRAFRNVLSNWGSYIVAMAINFFISPYIVRHLGTTGYGVWTLTISLTGYLGLLDLGVRGAVTRYVAKFHTENDHDKASNVGSSAIAIFASAGLLAILAALILAAFAIGRMQIPSVYLRAAQIVLILTGFNIAVSLVNGVYGGILVGLQRFDLTNSLEVGISLLRAGTIVAVLHMGFGIVALACIQLGFTMVRWAVNIALARYLYPELRIEWSRADRQGFKLIFSFSVFSFLLHISASLIYATDNVVIGAFLPVSAVTFYAIGGNLVEYARTIVNGISQTMTPMASSIDAKRDQQGLQQAVLFSSRAGTMVIMPVAVTFILRGSTFIGLWMGQQYAELSGEVLAILSVTLLFWAANSVVSGSILGLGKHKPLVPVMMVEGLCNLALSIVWIKGSLGIRGVAWGTVVPALATSLAFWPWYIRRTLGISRFAYMVSAWARPMTGVLPFAFVTYLVERYWSCENLLIFFAQVTLVLPVAALGYWLTCFSREQKQACLNKLSELTSRVFGSLSQAERP